MKSRTAPVRTPALDRVTSSILDAIHSGQYAETGALPPVRELSRQVKASLVTVWKACRSLVARGTLRSIPGHGFVVNDPSAPTRDSSAGALSAPPILRKQSAAARIYGAIERELLSGAWGPTAGAFSAKEIASRYDVDCRTARKAINALIRDGVLQPRGVAAAIRRPVRELKQRQIALLVHGGVSGGMDLTWLDQGFLRDCEETAYRAGAGLRLVTFTDNHDDIAYADPHTGLPCALDTKDTLGYLYLITVQRDFNERVFHDLSRIGKPVAIMDGKGEGDTSSQAGDTSFVKRFNFSTVLRPGTIVGRYLADTGHCHVAYLSAYHDQLWSRRRLDGLRQALRAADPEATVDAFCFDATATDAITRRKSADGTDLIVGPAWFASNGGPSPTSHAAPRIQCNPDACNALQEPARQALTKKTITAWVGGNDATALALLAILDERGIAVPRTLSVVGFDNGIEAVKWGLTSYDHNIGAVVNAAVNYVVRPRALGSWGRKRVVAIDGFVVERRSTAHAQGPRSSSAGTR